MTPLTIRMRQRGSIAVLTALSLALMVTALGAIDVGHVFFMRRSLQHIADMAALAAVQIMDNSCAQPSATATANALANGFSTSGILQTTCGRWDLSNAPSYFSSSVSGTNTQLNAVHVTVVQNVPYFFVGPTRLVSAQATAKATNIGAFTISTTLAQVQGGTINSVLNALLGANLSLSAASYQSLASARLKMGDLMTASGASTVSQLLSKSVTVAQLASLLNNALASTTISDANLQTDLSTLQTIANAHISNSATLPLTNAVSTPGLFSIGQTDPQSTLDATISPFDAIMAAAEIVQAGQAPVTVAGGLQIAGQGASLQVQVIQPPVLAVGEAGLTPGTQTWRTQANSAQIRMYLNISLGSASLPLGVLGALIATPVNLPLSLQVAPGSAWLASTNCTSSAATSTSVIGAQTGIANLCVGNAPTNLSASQPFSCTTPATLVNVANLVTIKAGSAIPAVVPQSNATTLTFYGTTGGYQSVNSNQAGSVLSTALSGLNASLTSGLSVSVIGVSLSASAVKTSFISFLGGSLNATLASLDQSLDPILRMLGVQIGVSEIHDLSLTCGVAQLTG